MSVNKESRNFISPDMLFARNSYGEIFEVGDIVKHEGEKNGQTATIESFSIDKVQNEIKVHTKYGSAAIDFIYKDK